VDLDLLSKVRLVTERDHGDPPDLLPDPVDPWGEVVEAPAVREVEHAEDPRRALEVRLLEQVEERALARDVEDHEVDLHGPRRGVREVDRPLRRDRAEGADVRVVEHAGHEAADQGGLPDTLFADEAELLFDNRGVKRRFRGRRVRGRAHAMETHERGRISLPPPVSRWN